MRLALRILAVVCLILPAAAVGLTYWAAGQNLPDTDPRAFLGVLVAVIGLLFAFATFVVGIVASAPRRQFGWLVGLIISGLVIILGPFVGSFTAASVYNSISANPACQGPSINTPACQPSGVQLILVNATPLMVLGGMFLVGLVALIYSFRMRTVPSREFALRT
jgi:hypothetical protein